MGHPVEVYTDNKGNKYIDTNTAELLLGIESRKLPVKRKSKYMKEAMASINLGVYKSSSINGNSKIRTVYKLEDIMKLSRKLISINRSSDELLSNMIRVYEKHVYEQLS